MRAMFQECNGLEYLDLSNLDTFNLIDVSWAFNGCQNLKEIKGINNFNTINVNSIYAMFRDCKIL